MRDNFVYIDLIIIKSGHASAILIINQSFDVFDIASDFFKRCLRNMTLGN